MTTTATIISNLQAEVAQLQAALSATVTQRDEHRDGRLAALERLAVAEKQRDELLAALRTAHAALDRDGDEWGICDQLAATIASVKGGAAEYMFNVDVEGKANAVFDTADEAVRYSMHHVYLSAAKFQEAVDTLNQGQVFMYSYGFAGVNIVPVAKRRVKAAGLESPTKGDNRREIN